MTAAAPFERPEPPVRKHVSLWATTLERLLLSLKGLPQKVDREGIKTAIDEALSSLGRLVKSEVDHEDHLERIDHTAQAIDGVRALLAETGDETARFAARGVERLLASLRQCRERTIDVIVADQERVLRGTRRTATSSMAAPFRASVGTPALHAIDREQLRPQVDIEPAAEDEEGESIDVGQLVAHIKGGQLAALASIQKAAGSEQAPQRVAVAPAQSAEAAAEAAAEAMQLRRLARSCMEDTAILGNLRRINDDEPWTSASRFEDRLLANIDAFASLGLAEPGVERDTDVLQLLLRYSTEVDFVDPGRAYARALLLGCIDGEDSMRALLIALKQSHPQTYAAQAEALALASSPAIGAAMKQLLSDEDPGLVKLALSTLYARRDHSFESLAPLLAHPDPDVVEAAARGLCLVEQKEQAAQLLAQLPSETSLQRVHVAAAESLLLLGARAGLGLVTAALGRESEEASSLSDAARSSYLKLLAIAGRAEHEELLLRLAGHDTAWALAVGWFGHVGLIGRLLDKLAAQNEIRQSIGPYPAPFEVAAAKALIRLTGAYLDNQDERLHIDVSIDAEQWRELLSGQLGRFERDVKYRFGKPYHPMQSLEELSLPETPPEPRRRCAMELSLLMGDPWGFEPGDWVARQQLMIGAAGEYLEEWQQDFQPGSWLGDMLVSRGLY